MPGYGNNFGIFGNVISNALSNIGEPLQDAVQQVFQPTGSRFTGAQQQEQQPTEQPQEQTYWQQPAAQEAFTGFFENQEEQPFSSQEKKQQQKEADDEASTPGTQNQNKSWLDILMSNMAEKAYADDGSGTPESQLAGFDLGSIADSRPSPKEAAENFSIDMPSYGVYDPKATFNTDISSDTTMFEDAARNVKEGIENPEGAKKQQEESMDQMDRFLKFVEENPEWLAANGISDVNPYTDFRVNASDDAWWDLVGGEHAIWNDIFRNDVENYGNVNWDAEDARDQFINALNANALNAYLYFNGADGYNAGNKAGSSANSLNDLAEYAMNNWNGGYALYPQDIQALSAMGINNVPNNALNNKEDFAYLMALNSIANTGSLGGLTVNDLNTLARAAGETGMFGKGDDYQTGEQSKRTNTANTQGKTYYGDVFSGNSQMYPLWQTPEGNYIPANAVDLILAADPNLGFKEG